MSLQHGSMLKPSEQDTIALAMAVEDRFLDICAAWRRVRGVDIPFPESLNVDWLRWREMRVRHKRGDFRNSDAELKSTKSIAQWTLDMNASLRNQKPQKLACLEV